ncbi:FkbM family methyltransferase [Halochromatium sp.]
MTCSSFLRSNQLAYTDLLTPEGIASLFRKGRPPGRVRRGITQGSNAELRHGVVATLEHGAALGRETVNTVIDVGANKGQFASYARLRWPKARLICVEPLPEPRAKLTRITRCHAEIHACALGAEEGTG